MTRPYVSGGAAALAFAAALAAPTAQTSTPPDDALVKKARGIHERVIALDTHDDINAAELHPRAQLHAGSRQPGQPAEDDRRRPRRVVLHRLCRPGSAHARRLRQRLQAGDREVRRDPPADREDRARQDRAGADRRRRPADQQGRQEGRADRRRERLPARATPPPPSSASRSSTTRGARYLSLAHNGHSQLADSNTGEATGEWLHNGLSDLGKQVIAELNRVGIMVDLSHPSKQANLQAIALSKAPVIASHSAARALCDHSRDLDDEQLLAIKKNGGVVADGRVCELRQDAAAADRRAAGGADKARRPTSACRPEPRTRRTWRAVVAAQRLGAGTAAAGSGREVGDAGGALAQLPRRQARRSASSGWPRSTSSSRRRRARTSRTSSITSTTSSRRLASITSASRRTSTAAAAIDGWNDASETFNVTLELVRRGYTEDQIAKIWSGNLLRVMEEVRQVALKLQK